MRTEVVRSAFGWMVALALAGCSGSDSTAAAGRELDETGFAATGTAPAATTPVPALDCASASVAGRPEYTLNLRPSDDGGGTLALNRYYLVDGQFYRVGTFRVTAEAVAGDAGTSLLVTDEDGRVSVVLGEDGTAQAHILSPYGFPLDVPLQCTAASLR